MGFELGQVDDHIRRQGVPGQIDAAERAADVHGSRVAKLMTRYVQVRQGIPVTAFAQDPTERAHGRAVGDRHPGALFQGVLGHGPDYQRMGQDGPFRCRRHEQVRFDQHPHARRDPVPADHRQHLPNGRRQRHRMVPGVSEKNTACLHRGRRHGLPFGSGRNSFTIRASLGTFPSTSRNHKPSLSN